MQFWDEKQLIFVSVKGATVQEVEFPYNKEFLLCIILYRVKESNILKLVFLKI